ncbi:MAG: single-stranded-DNA-specific exonuclease RecJ [Eubacteriales bacterium]|nr:single-stranded-DNA-specific exonuclease RecJ [Eubacteriales bacterium]
MRNKIWCYKNRGIDLEELKAFSEQYNLPPVISTILFNRGIKDGNAAKLFIQKPLSGVHNPLDLPDMPVAAKRIAEAIKNNEKIVVYGDYDVDGITSVVLMYSYLKSEGADVDYYIPDRVSEGYGINIMAINKIARSGAKLMITVDCGVTAVGEVEFARTQKLDVIITDHHTCKEDLPRAVAVVNPKREDSEYPFDALAGVGVSFKTVLAVAMELGRNTRDVFMRYVELAAIGTIADVMSVTDENRIIIEHGLEVMKNGGNIGIKALLEVSGALQRPVDAAMVAYIVAPRINAAGRIGNADTAVRLLLSETEEEAKAVAAELDCANRERQEAEQAIFEEAMDKVMKDATFDKKQVIVLSGEGWHHGVIGIVASRICERFYKPCILVSFENGVGKGSGRSIPGFNLFDALAATEEHLTNFGGHSAAAGLGINADSIDAFTAAINKYAAGVLTAEDMIPKIDIDCRLKPETVSVGFAKALKKLEPFGTDNERPVFSVLGVKIIAIDTVGVDKKHLKMRVASDDTVISAIGFNMSEYAMFFKNGDIVDVAFSADINVYQGRESAQLLLKDMKKHSSNN